MSVGGWHSRQSEERERRVRRAESPAHQVSGTQSVGREEHKEFARKSLKRWKHKINSRL